MTDPANDNDTNETPADEGSAAATPPDQLEGALEAAEATLNRTPEVDYLLVADRAEVVNGKLYLMGGSWDRVQPQQFPHRMMLGIALGVRIPFAYTDDQHTVAIELLHGETRMIGFEAKLATGRPPGMAKPDAVHGDASAPPSHTTPSFRGTVWLPEWNTAAQTVSPSVASARGVSPNSVRMVSGVPPGALPRLSASNTQTSARPMPSVVNRNARNMQIAGAPNMIDLT